jgi:dipeptidyl aminopeptidase/acylaminoacyl peptidase
MNKWSALGLVLGIFGAAAGRSASPPSIEEFAARSKVEDVAISPDGRYLAQIRTLDGKAMVVVADRRAGPNQVMTPVLGEPEHFKFRWCHFATDTRLLCGFIAMVKERIVYGTTRLVAVDVDGKNTRVLIQNSWEAQGQFQDRIINWSPGPPNTVLIEADEGLSMEQLAGNVQVYGNVGTHALPAVFELNVVTGQVRIRQHARDPIRHWITDRQGTVRLGWGSSGTTRSYWAHLDGEANWRRLSKFEVFSREAHFDPIAISAEDPNAAYALGPSEEGREALWLIDLKDKEDPRLVFSHPIVDVTNPILSRDGRLLGARYDNGNPMIYYTDDRIAAVMGAIQRKEPATFNTVYESSIDDKVLVVRLSSDIDAPRFAVLDTVAASLAKVGAPYPDRDLSTLAPMRAITYPARDGTLIPAYLSTPRGVSPTHLPLIVMPHGGPIARDTWGYFFLREFLVSRGYAVLQMNFRGSDGYGGDWFFAAHQDWGGLTYDDVVDGARWAIQQGITDPQRVCVVGWSFGGYIALVGAQRNPELFHCAVDIAGVSDLGLLIEEGHDWLGGEVVKKQIGFDRAKLKRDSPHLHAEDFKVPLLMLHGQMDAQVPFEQSEVMDAALKRAHVAHRFTVVPGADHSFTDVKDRATLLKETEDFLRENLPAGGPAAATGVTAAKAPAPP